MQANFEPPRDGQWTTNIKTPNPNNFRLVIWLQFCFDRNDVRWPRFCNRGCLIAQRWNDKYERKKWNNCHILRRGRKGAAGTISVQTPSHMASLIGTCKCYIVFIIHHFQYSLKLATQNPFLIRRIHVYPLGPHTLPETFQTPLPRAHWNVRPDLIQTALEIHDCSRKHAWRVKS